MMKDVAMSLFSLVYEVLQRQVRDHDELVELGARVGHPYVPGEDVRAYRRRLVTLRDEEPHRFAPGRVA